MFTPITSHAEAQAAMQKFMTNNTGLPEQLYEKLEEAFGALSPVMRMTSFAEILWANKDKLPKESLDLCASLAAWCSHPQNAFGRFGKEAATMAGACCRLAGYEAPLGYAWPTEEEDPAIKEQFVVELPADQQLSIPLGEENSND